MTTKKDFFGKDVAAAIEEARIDFAVSQEQLDIDIVETGSTGIFGLCRKKAHIRVTLKDAGGDKPDRSKKKGARPRDTEKSGNDAGKTKKNASRKDVETSAGPPARDESAKKTVKEKQKKHPPQPSVSTTAAVREAQKEGGTQEISEDLLQHIQEELQELLCVMRFPSQVKVTSDTSGVLCHITGAYEKEIIGDDGRTLDSLQYLLRKMVSRQLPDRTVLTVDVGNFRARRAEELREQALELAKKVLEDGRTQAIPALNPSERRVVHMALQDSSHVRSRSVGDGLFKKILIYRPGKTRKSESSQKRKGRQGGDRAGSE
ncbi:MAG: RNA-binding protein [Desulfobulbus propionicus]|nr:MAG: RNA-binding protein [Desulfobulbus propionicus]